MSWAVLPPVEYWALNFDCRRFDLGCVEMKRDRPEEADFVIHDVCCAVFKESGTVLLDFAHFMKWSTEQDRRRAKSKLSGPKLRWGFGNSVKQLVPSPVISRTMSADSADSRGGLESSLMAGDNGQRASPKWLPFPATTQALRGVGQWLRTTSK